MGKESNLIKKTSSIIIIFLILLMALPAYAADFKDVPSNHWAKPYIDRMSEAGIVTGYEGNLFKPKEDVSKLESLVFVSRLLDVSTNDKANARLRYGDSLSELKVPEWARESLAICLVKEVITPTDLINISRQGLNSPAQKIDITEYLVKAMGLEDLANEKTMIALPFVDAMSIDSTKDKYVAVLVDLKIVEGDEGNKFNPKSNVKREVMVTMLSRTYDEIQRKPTTPKEELETKEGVVTKTPVIGEQYLVTIEDRFGDSKTYRIDKQKTTVNVDGKRASVDDIASGQRVKITVEKDDNIAISIDIESIDEEYTGKIKFLYTNVYPPSDKVTIEYEENKKTYQKTLDIDEKADIYLDESVSYLSKLKEGYIAKFKVRNDKIYEIDARSKNLTVEGILRNIKKDGTTYYLTIVDSKDKSHEYQTHKDVYVVRNKKKASIEDLKIKDQVYLELEYDRIVDIDAKIVKKEIEGIITSISHYLYKNTEIAIRNLETKEEESFVLGTDPYIRVDKKVINSYDIKPGYHVELTVEGEEITEIYADSSSIGVNITGKIDSINYRREYMVVTSKNILYEDLFGEEVTVYLTDDAVIWDSRSNRLDFDDLSRNDTVTITGSYDGSTFMANRIILE